MTDRMTRLGLSLPGIGPVSEMIEQAQRAEQLGFDVVLLLDHLGPTAPLPPLVAIADAVPSIRVGSLVLNTAFYRAQLLARDLQVWTPRREDASVSDSARATPRQSSPLRDFPFRAPPNGSDTWGSTFSRSEGASRIRPTSHRLCRINRRFMIAAGGEKLLDMAVRRADVVAIGGLGSEEHVAERAEYVNRLAGDRRNAIELAFSYFQVSLDDHDDLSALYLVDPEADPAYLHNAATYLSGPVEAAADRVRKARDDLGFNYFTFHKTAATSWDTLQKLVDAIRD